MLSPVLQEQGPQLHSQQGLYRDMHIRHHCCAKKKKRKLISRDEDNK